MVEWAFVIGCLVPLLLVLVTAFRVALRVQALTQGFEGRDPEALHAGASPARVRWLAIATGVFVALSAAFWLQR